MNMAMLISNELVHAILILSIHLVFKTTLAQFIFLHPYLILHNFSARKLDLIRYAYIVHLSFKMH